MSQSDAQSEWGDPGALGFAPLAGINLVFAGDFLGWWGTDVGLLVASIGVVGGICQFAAGLISLRNGDSTGGTLMAAFGMLFMWGPGLMLVADAVGPVGSLNPFFGAWTMFLGVLLGMWSIALVVKPWFEFLIGPTGGLTLVSAGLADLFAFPRAIAGVLFLWLFVWGLYMLAHSLGVNAGVHVPLGRPASAWLGVGSEADATVGTPASGD